MLVFTLSDELYDDILGQKSDSQESFSQCVYIYNLSGDCRDPVRNRLIGTVPIIIYYDCIFQYLVNVPKFQIYLQIEIQQVLAVLK